MKLGHWPNSQKLHIYRLSTPGGRTWSYFSSTGSSFQNMSGFLKLPYLGMKHGHRPKFQKLRIPSFYPSGSKLSLFSLYGQLFPRYGPIFKISIFGQQFPRHGPIFKLTIYLGTKLVHWSKFQKLNIYPLSTPGSQNWAYFRSTGSGFRYTGRFVKLSCLGIKLGQSCRSCTYTLFLSQWVKLSLFLLYGQQFLKYGLWILPYLGMKLCNLPVFQKLHIYPLSTQGVEKT